MGFGDIVVIALVAWLAYQWGWDEGYDKGATDALEEASPCDL